MDPEVKNVEVTKEGAAEEPEKMEVAGEVAGEEAGETADNKANEKVEGIEKGDQEKEKAEEVDEGPKMLDLAFGMDCTGSMGSYIHQAQQVS